MQICAHQNTRRQAQKHACSSFDIVLEQNNKNKNNTISNNKHTQRLMFCDHTSIRRQTIKYLCCLWKTEHLLAAFCNCAFQPQKPACSSVSTDHRVDNRFQVNKHAKVEGLMEARRYQTDFKKAQMIVEINISLSKK